MDRSWTDLLAFLITSFASAPGVTAGPECPLGMLCGEVPVARPSGPLPPPAGKVGTDSRA